MVTNLVLMEAIGLLAGLCTTVSFLPQALMVIKTRDTTSISLLMYIVFVGGVCLWMVYGLLITSLPIMLWNFCTLLLAGTILVMKLRFG